MDTHWCHASAYCSDAAVVLYLDLISYDMSNAHDFANVIQYEFCPRIEPRSSLDAISYDFIASLLWLNLNVDPEAANFASLQSWPDEVARVDAGGKLPHRGFSAVSVLMQ